VNGIRSNRAKVMMVVALTTHMTLRNDADEETLKAVAFSGYVGKDLPSQTKSVI